MENNFEIRIISDPEGFDSLKCDWESLHEVSCTTVFQSFAWLRTWWRHFGEGAPDYELHVVSIRMEGRQVAIAPFYIQSMRISALASTRELKLIGEGLSDYLDLIVMPGLERELLPVLAAHVAGLWKKLDSVNLVEIPEDSLVGRIFGEELRAAGVGVSVEKCEACPRVALGETWEETLAGLRGKHRRRIQASARRLSELQPTGYEFVEDGTSLDDSMTDFLSLHQERMEDTDRSGAFGCSENEAFIREACREFQKKGWLLLSFLTLSGKRVAATCCYLHKGRLYYYNGGIGEVGEAWKFSPGVVLQGYCMQEAIRRGVKIYDFLRGTEPYKYRFGAVDFHNWRIVARRTRTWVRVMGAVGTFLGKVRRKVGAVRRGFRIV